MTIRNRRRNRWRKKLRRCNQCKYWKITSGLTSCCTIDGNMFDMKTLLIFRDRYKWSGYGSSWWKCAIACPHYDAYDRTQPQITE